MKLKDSRTESKKSSSSTSSSAPRTRAASTTKSNESTSAPEPRLRDRRFNPLQVDFEILNLPLSSRAVKIYLGILHFTRQNPYCWPTYQTLGDLCLGAEYPTSPTWRRRAVMDGIKELLAWRVVVREHRFHPDGGNSSNKFYVCDKSDWKHCGELRLDEKGGVRNHAPRGSAYPRTPGGAESRTPGSAYPRTPLKVENVFPRIEGRSKIEDNTPLLSPPASQGGKQKSEREERDAARQEASGQETVGKGAGDGAASRAGATSGRPARRGARREPAGETPESALERERRRAREIVALIFHKEDAYIPHSALSGLADEALSRFGLPVLESLGKEAVETGFTGKVRWDPPWFFRLCASRHEALQAETERAGGKAAQASH